MPVTPHPTRPAQVVITRLLAEEDPAWISKMDDEVRLGKSILAKTALLRSVTGLAEVALQQDGTVAATCAALAPCLYQNVSKQFYLPLVARLATQKPIHD